MRPRNARSRFASIATSAARGIALLSPSALILLASLGSISAVVAAPSIAHADIEHTVQRGHTLEAISNRYHVTKKLIIDANHLRPGQHLRIGEVLVIPGVGNDKLGASGAGAKGKLGKNGKPLAQTYAMRPRTPGVVKLTRVALKEDFTVRVADRRGKQPPNASKEFEKLMRSPNGGATHEIDSRLIALVGIVSNHFGGRKLEVVSGYRPYTPTQYNPHSNHNHGRAIDFRVAGVPNEVVRDFCRTLHNTGCGYYPNSVFVHMDVRDKPAYWIDYSRPGEAPRYNSPNADADEAAGDIHRENPYETSPGDAAQPSQPSATPDMNAPNANAPSGPSQPTDPNAPTQPPTPVQAPTVSPNTPSTPNQPAPQSPSQSAPPQATPQSPSQSAPSQTAPQSPSQSAPSQSSPSQPSQAPAPQMPERIAPPANSSAP